MVNINPKPLNGPWAGGFALDLHTLSSTMIGYDQFGHEVFDTKRTEIGELLYQLKYRSDQTVVRIIAEVAVDFLRHKDWQIDLVMAVPPSVHRTFQPAIAVAQAIAATLGVAYCGDCIAKVRDTPQLKDVFDHAERISLLKDAFAVSKTAAVGKRILLFDDLYRSGATLEAISYALLKESSIAALYVLTLTMTRTKQ